MDSRNAGHRTAPSPPGLPDGPESWQHGRGRSAQASVKYTGGWELRASIIRLNVNRLRTALLLALLAPAAGAQVIQARPPKLTDQWVFGISGFGGIPVGDFKRHEDGGGGMELFTGFQPFRRQPLVLRGNGGFLLYGRYNRNADREYCDQFGQNCFTETVFYNSRYHNMSFFQADP